MCVLVKKKKKVKKQWEKELQDGVTCYFGEEVKV